MACGAIAQPAASVVARNAWPVDIHPLPPLLHNRPHLIADEVRRLAVELSATYDAVANGKEAVEAVVQEHYHVIVMDCQMPVVDGYEATLEIRKLERNGAAKHRIIAMTANAL